MVRYPKKSTPYQSISPVPSPKITATSVGEQPQRQQTDAESKVKELNDHIKILEEKLKSIESSVNASTKVPAPQQSPKRNTFQFKKRWLAPLILLLIIPLTAFYHHWAYPAYTATIGFYTKSSLMNKAVGDIVLTKEQQSRMIVNEQSIVRAWTSASHWPLIIASYPWVLKPVVWIYQRQITIEKHPSENGLVLNVSANRMEKARDIATALVQEYFQTYANDRRSRISEIMAKTEEQIKEIRNRLANINALLAKYPSSERAFVVSARVKKGLDRITSERALELEEDYSRLKDQSASITLKALDRCPDFDQVIFSGLLSRLKDMELKQYLVGKSQNAVYEGGIRPIKAAVAAMINSCATKDASMDPNMMIKSAFNKARFDALDALLNKRYGSLSSFSGRMAEYAGLSAELEKRFQSLEILIGLKMNLSKILQGNIQADIVVDMPLIVVKKGRD